MYPQAKEYGQHYHTYVITVNPEENIVEALESQFQDSLGLLSSLDEEKQLYRYAPGKWSIREMVGHMIDTEKVMAYRAMRIARGDTTHLPGFEQDDYIATGEFDKRSMQDLLGEWSAVRQASVAFVKSLSIEAAARMGTASNTPVSARAIIYIIAGHERHHMRILRERYL